MHNVPKRRASYKQEIPLTAEQLSTLQENLGSRHCT